MSTAIGVIHNTAAIIERRRPVAHDEPASADLAADAIMAFSRDLLVPFGLGVTVACPVIDAERIRAATRELLDQCCEHVAGTTLAWTEMHVTSAWVRLVGHRPDAQAVVSLSNSSWTSPRTCSSASSRVTIPATDPYSLTTIARCRSSSRSMRHRAGTVSSSPTASTGRAPPVQVTTPQVP